MKGESEVPGGALNLISTNYPDPDKLNFTLVSLGKVHH